jgi:hypothetical protein
LMPLVCLVSFQHLLVLGQMQGSIGHAHLRVCLTTAEICIKGRLFPSREWRRSLELGVKCRDGQLAGQSILLSNKYALLTNTKHLKDSVCFRCIVGGNSANTELCLFVSTSSNCNM